MSMSGQFITNKRFGATPNIDELAKAIEELENVIAAHKREIGILKKNYKDLDEIIHIMLFVDTDLNIATTYLDRTIKGVPHGLDDISLLFNLVHKRMYPELDYPSLKGIKFAIFILFIGLFCLSFETFARLSNIEADQL